MRLKIDRLFFVVFLLLCSFAISRGDDWPQWLGPKRDGVWRENGLVDRFPKEGVKILWRTPVGGGYAGPAVAGGRVFVMDHLLAEPGKAPASPWSRATVPGVERVLCVDEKSGKLLWTHEYHCPYDISYGAGPRATPAVDGDRVYTLGAEGDLLCLNVADGKEIWSHHLAGEKSPTPMWGFAGHPLVDGQMLIVLSCGNDPAAGHGLFTAFNKKTGEMIWTALADKPAGYAPPMIVSAGGCRQLIAWSPNALSSLDPETGKTFWTQPHGPIKNGVSITTPRFVHDEALGDLLLVSSANEGCLVMKLDADAPKASVYWKRGGTSERKTDALHSLMAPPVLRDGHIYGVCIGGELRCLDLKTGNRIWETYAATTGEIGRQSWATAFIIPLGDAGSRFLLANEKGDLILADLTPRGYSEISRTHLLDPTNTDAGRPVIWCHPAFANRCVFWRNDKEMVCGWMGAGSAESQ